MRETDSRGYLQKVADDAIGGGHATAWFEQVYAAAEAGRIAVPWFDGAPTRLLVEWADRRGLDGTGRQALVIGCGLGDDAEFVAGRGFDTVAFDVAPTAVAGARRRFPESRVDYRVADLFDLPTEWRHGFDLVVEVLTVQSLPDPERYRAIRAIAGTVAPGGTLIVISGTRDLPLAEETGPPWPLDRTEIESFAEHDLERIDIERLPPSGPGTGTWRAEFRRP